MDVFILVILDKKVTRHRNNNWISKSYRRKSKPFEFSSAVCQDLGAFFREMLEPRAKNSKKRFQLLNTVNNNAEI